LPSHRVAVPADTRGARPERRRRSE
jgi:hypothetical protein